MAHRRKRRPRHVPDAPATGPNDSSLRPFGPISYVTLECREIAPTRRFYEDFLGLRTERLTATSFIAPCPSGVSVLAVEVGEKVVPQPVQNHHGISLQGDPTLIDALHRTTSELASEFEIRRVTKAVPQHGSYSFYFEDRDTNWWELEVLESPERDV